MEGKRPVCKRQWVHQTGSHQDQRDLTVMTYNILSDVYVKPGDYDYCPEEARYQKSRASHIVSEVEFYSPDIVCFQEVAEDHFVSILSTLMEKIGYAGCHMSYTYRKNDGLSIFYKKARLNLIRMDKFQVGNLINEYAKKNLDNKMATAIRKVAKLSCGLLVGQFKQLADNKIVTIGNVHVTWSEFQLPGLQTLEVAVCYHAVKDAASGSPFILCGDFNSTPTYAPYHLLARGSLEPDDSILNTYPEFRIFEIRDGRDRCDGSSDTTVEVSMTDTLVNESAHSEKWSKEIRDLVSIITRQLLGAFNTDIPMKSAYKSVLGREPDVTNCDADTWKGHVTELCLDYLWYTKDLLATRVLDSPTRESIRRHLALPSVLHPSDHIPLMAGFRFT